MRAGEDNVVSVLVRNMGHNEDGGNNDAHKNAARAAVGHHDRLGDARRPGASRAHAAARTRSTPTRGVLNNGGLHGERAGWALPGYPTDSWETVTTPTATATPGVSWYSTDVRLGIPKDQDTPIGLHFGETTPRSTARWCSSTAGTSGSTSTTSGPQRTFYLPQGVLRHQGTNRISLAVWSDDGAGLGPISLTTYGNHRTSQRIHDIDSPSYDEHAYAERADTSLRIDAPSAVEDGASFPVTAELDVPAAESPVSGTTYELTAPSGWTVDRTGDSAWTVTAPESGRTSKSPPARLVATATFQQEGTCHRQHGAAGLPRHRHRRAVRGRDHHHAR